MKIWANCLVNNEENFIWFSLMSVVDYVDKILVWDSGSTDKTVEIIEEVRKKKGDKIEFKETGPLDKNEFTKMRQKMLEQSDCDWILILDGDEIWWEDSIRKLVNEIKTEGSKIEGVAVPFKIPVGDIYHFQDESKGKYELLSRRGNLSLRAINKKIPGLHVDWPYGKEGYFDNKGCQIQERKDIIYLDTPYLHLTHLQRSGKNGHGKFKYDRGIKVKKDFLFPEVFYLSGPDKIPSPFVKRSPFYEILSFGKGLLKR